MIFFCDLMYVLISLRCHNEMCQTGAINKRKLISYSSGGLLSELWLRGAVGKASSCFADGSLLALY